MSVATAEQSVIAEQLLKIPACFSIIKDTVEPILGDIHAMLDKYPATKHFLGKDTYTPFSEEDLKTLTRLKNSYSLAIKKLQSSLPVLTNHNDSYSFLNPSAFSDPFLKKMASDFHVIATVHKAEIAKKREEDTLSPFEVAYAFIQQMKGSLINGRAPFYDAKKLEHGAKDHAFLNEELALELGKINDLKEKLQKAQELLQTLLN